MLNFAKLSFGERLLIKAILVAVLLGGAAAAGAATTGMFGRDGTGTTPVTFAIVGRAPYPLPVGSLTPTLRRLGTDPDTDAHLAARIGGLQYFVVTPRGQDLICLTIRDVSDVTANSCAARSALTSHDVVWISHAKPGDVFDLYGLAPDGVDQVDIAGATARVTNNVFYAKDVPDTISDAVVVGPGVRAEFAVSAGVAAGATVGPNP
jgi:hypothetical protein